MSFKKDLIYMLEEFADLMEFKGENRFKVNAFRNGANTIRRFEGDFESAVDDGSIKNVKGIGKGLLAFISEFRETGKVEDYNTLKNEVPQGILDILSIRGLGAKKVKVLFEVAGIDDLIKLESACKNDVVANIKGFGGKTQEKLIDELERIKRESGYIHLSRATRLASEIGDILESSPDIKEYKISGELRRSMEVIASLDFVVLSENIENIASMFDSTEVKENLIRIKSYTIPVNLHVISTVKDFIRILFETTGSGDFVKNSEISSDGEFETEEQIFEKSGFPYVIPEMREEHYFENKPSNSDLEFSKFKGLLHFHTQWSDGLNSLEEMRKAAAERGFEYVAVCDHSKSAFYANGLKEDRVLEQKEEISKANSIDGIKVFQGIESDIVASGDLDYPEDFLSNFDFVVASIHSNFNMSEDEMTARIIKAVDNPYTDLLAHPTGRLLLSRKGYKLNIKKIIDACAANDVAIEINANAHRLDLDWRNLYYANEKGVKISINPDAHSVEGIGDTKYGIGIARKGGVQAKDVINCFSENEFIKFINRKVEKYKSQG